MANRYACTMPPASARKATRPWPRNSWIEKAPPEAPPEAPPAAMPVAKQFGLGRGLGALIPEPEIAAAISDAMPKPELSGEAATAVASDRTLPIAKLKANPEQPRRS